MLNVRTVQMKFEANWEQENRRRRRVRRGIVLERFLVKKPLMGCFNTGIDTGALPKSLGDFVASAVN